MKPITSAISTALICTSVFLANQLVYAEVTGAPPQLDQLNDFLGDGKCTGNLMATEKSSGHASVAHFHGEKILDGNWIVVHYDEDRTAENPKPYHVVQYLGYDSKKKQFVGVELDNSGSSYGAGVSSGWKGDTFNLDDTTAMDGKIVSARDVFTRKGSNELTHTGMMREKNGKWVKMDEETCHKS